MLKIKSVGNEYQNDCDNASLSSPKDHRYRIQTLLLAPTTVNTGTFRKITTISQQTKVHAVIPDQLETPCPRKNRKRGHELTNNTDPASPLSVSTSLQLSLLLSISDTLF